MDGPLTDVELARRLILAALLGAALGFERELRQKSAGLRTNILIAVGSAVFTLMSVAMADTAGGDHTRIAAQIVTGVGFLGAGAIMRTNAGIQGLTTAATVWVNAAIGVAAGAGEYHLAVIGTAVALVVLLVMAPLEGFLDRRLALRRQDNGEDNGPTGGGPFAAGASPGAPGPDVPHPPTPGQSPTRRP
jgi:putative Mg2+ transporter-C (MgtC) family protein